MDDRHPNEADLDRFRRNLEALAENRPALAATLDALPLPADFERTVGRDGSDTFRRRGPDGNWQWLGRSSMPTISAPALVGRPQTGGRNLILPAILTGHEALIALQFLPPYAAVFAYEADPVALKLVLHVRDLSAAILSRRLVLLCGEDVESVLREFFAAHPGFEFPQHLLPLPILRADVLERFKVQLEAAARQVTVLQHDAGAAIQQGWTDWTVAPVLDAPRILFLSRDPRPETAALARRLVRAAGSLGWDAAANLPDRPDRCHVVSRLRDLDRHRPDAVVLLKCVQGPLASAMCRLPVDLAVCSWLTDPQSAQAGVSEGFTNDRILFAASPEVSAVLSSNPSRDREGAVALAAREPLPHGRGLEEISESRAGVSVADCKIELLEIAADAVAFHPLPDEPRRFDVVILADAADLRPEAAGLRLASHTRLWTELCSAAGWHGPRARGHALDPAWTDASAFELLAHAEGDSGVTLSEPELRELFLRQIRLRLAPTAITRAAIERLARSGLSVAVWGRGWNETETVRPLVQGPIPDDESANAVLHAAAVMVCPWFDAGAVQRVLDCLAAGRCPLFRAPDEPLRRLHPQLVEVLDLVPHAKRLDALVQETKRLVHAVTRGRHPAAAARRALLEGHTLAHRLTAMRARLQHKHETDSARSSACLRRLVGARDSAGRRRGEAGQ